MVARDAVGLVGAGSAAGMVLAAGAARVSAQRFDPIVAVVCAVAMFGIAAAASTIPAVRASRIDPVRALRQE